MKARSFVVLSALTLAVVVAAAVAVTRVHPAQSVAGAGEKVFPQLTQQLDQIAAIVAEDAGGVVTVEQGAQGWGIRERDGYPASFEKVKGAVLALVELQKSEAKTVRPASFARLGVEALDQADAKSKKLSLLDADGKPIAALIVGRSVFDLAGEGGAYVRLPDSTQVWLTRGAVNFGAQVPDWIDRRIVNVPPADVKQLHVVRADGTTLTVSRAPAAEGGWKLLEAEKDTRLKRPEILDSMASAIATVEAEDVVPAAQRKGDGSAARVELVTFDGLRLSGTISEADGRTWLRLRAATAPEAAGEAEARAAAINQHIDGWAYEVPAWKVEPLLKPLSDLVADGEGPGVR